MDKKIKKKGALPVPYIVAIIIAILVIAVLVYWFFVLSNQGTGTGQEVICRGKEISYCTQWATSGFDPAREPNNQDFTQWAPDCVSLSWAKSVSPTNCRSILSQQTTTTT